MVSIEDSSLGLDFAYRTFGREQWGRYRQDSPLTLTTADLDQLRGINDPVSLSEIENIYLPLSRLVQMLVTESRRLHVIVDKFLGELDVSLPYIIGMSGSVAVGKSTISRVLQALLSRCSEQYEVALVTTDGFLYSNAQLEERQLMQRKGFPESYDLEALLHFLYALKSGKSDITVPVYSHHAYDVLPDERLQLSAPDIVIVEGLNILQTGSSVRDGVEPRVYVSDFLDFSIFIDADTRHIEQWFLTRLRMFCEGPMQKPDAYFHFLTRLNEEELMKFGQRVWREINCINLEDNILPFRERADLILHKNADHEVDYVKTRNL